MDFPQVPAADPAVVIVNVQHPQVTGPPSPAWVGTVGSLGTTAPSGAPAVI